jgi:hypothetical protein
MPFSDISSPGLTATKLALIKLGLLPLGCKHDASNAIIASLHCSSRGISSAGA